MSEVKYEQGMTKVWSDGEKVVITNSTGNRHVEVNVDNIFGVGEFKKLQEHCYSEGMDKRQRNYEMVTGHIPERVVKDMLERDLPGDSEESLTKRYFKDV